MKSIKFILLTLLNTVTTVLAQNGVAYPASYSYSVQTNSPTRPYSYLPWFNPPPQFWQFWFPYFQPAYNPYLRPPVRPTNSKPTSETQNARDENILPDNIFGMNYPNNLEEIEYLEPLDSDY